MFVHSTPLHSFTHTKPFINPCFYSYYFSQLWISEAPPWPDWLVITYWVLESGRVHLQSCGFLVIGIRVWRLQLRRLITHNWTPKFEIISSKRFQYLVLFITLTSFDSSKPSRFLCFQLTKLFLLDFLWFSWNSNM